MRLDIATMAAWLMAASPALAGSVSGLASDEDGKPLAGVDVEVVYQTYNADKLMGYGASIKAGAQTGADGRYHIDISRLPPGEYSANAWTTVDNGGQAIFVDLVPDFAATFPAPTKRRAISQAATSNIPKPCPTETAACSC